MININALREHVVAILKNGLPPTLTYHNSDHALDVAKQCLEIAKEEEINDEQILLELQIAGLYHDTGFLFAYKGHEEKSYEIAKRELHDFGLDKKSIDDIGEIIMATKMPQAPKNHLQQIICDADLDYLGRGDFFILSEKLHKEFIEYEIACNDKEWKDSRIAFLQSHSYFTKSQKERRNTSKQAHLNFLKKVEEISN